jgi:hypothetical protein
MVSARPYLRVAGAKVVRAGKFGNPWNHFHVKLDAAHACQSLVASTDRLEEMVISTAGNYGGPVVDIWPG